MKFDYTKNPMWLSTEIGDYGYQRVMTDLENYIADKVNRLVDRAIAEDSDE
jgi:hypothetical protein